MYFYYGIKHSSLEEQSFSDGPQHDGTAESSCVAGNIELRVTEAASNSQRLGHHRTQDRVRNIYEDQQQLDVFGQPIFGSTNFGGTPNRHNVQVQQQQQQSANNAALFVETANFPSWDD